ncbi:MAG: hypothetical protein HYY25_15490 [Candidatus Wallbacteria bacterium]|nr:hypothetical protein [Candidatus Wallbacteria bacterium]
MDESNADRERSLRICVALGLFRGVVIAVLFGFCVIAALLEPPQGPGGRESAWSDEFELRSLSEQGDR